MQQLAACTGAAAATAVAVPLALSGGGNQGTQPAPAAAGHMTATQSAQGHPAILMPDVTGMKLKDAEVVILSVTTHGHITILHIKTTQTAGVVIRQAPSPGARVATDSQITLTVPKAS